MIPGEVEPWYSDEDELFPSDKSSDATEDISVISIEWDTD